MANIKLTLPAEPFSKQIVTFTAPCGCDQVTDGLVINGETYTVCDAMGECVTGKGGAWCAGAQISVVLDCENKKAFIQNAASPNLKDALNSHIDNQSNPHNVTADQVAVTENVVNAFKETGNWSVDGILAQIGSTLFGGVVMYRWQKTKVILTEVANENLRLATDGAYDIYYSSEIAVNTDNTMTLVNHKKMTLSLSQPLMVPEGAYFIPNLFATGSVTTSSLVYRAKSNCLASLEKPGSITYMGISNVLRVAGSKSVELLTSINPNAHYDGEVDADGYTYTALDPITAFVPRIQTGSYTGTGTYGANNPTRITASFSPKLAVIASKNASGNCCSLAVVTPSGGFGCANPAQSIVQAQFHYLEASVEGNTLSFFSRETSNGVNFQQNISGYTYDFVVVG